MNIFLTTIGLSIALTLTANAQTLVKIGNSEHIDIFVRQGNANQRIGNAVLVRLYTINTKSNWKHSPLVLAACDGSWVTNSIQEAFDSDGQTSLENMYEYAKMKEVFPPLDTVYIYPTSEAKLYYAKSITKHAPSLCKTAGKEPKNVLIPVTSSRDKDSISSSYAIVLGTSTQEKDSIDVWVRSTKFKRIPHLKSDGQPLEILGEVQMKKETTGSHEMQRIAINCKAKKMSIYELVEYKEEGSKPTTNSIPRNELSLSSVIPNSTGETIFDSVCTLYERK